MKMASAAAAPLLLLLLALAAGAGAVTFEATNTVPDSAGGQRFDQDFGGVDYAKQVLAEASSFIWTALNEPNPEDRPSYDSVTLTVVDNIDAPAQTSGSTIQLRAQYVAGFNGDVKEEVKGVLYHEATHVWQWGLQDYGQKSGLFEGIADYVRLKAGLAPGHWVKPGQGDRWDQGYDVTAHFLDYCDSLQPGFVAEMNGKLKDGYSDDYFAQILGKSADELWSDYKAKSCTRLHCENMVQRFDQVYGGADYAKQVLSDASSFIWTTFNEPNPEDRKDYDTVTLTVTDNIQPGAVAVTSGNAILLRAQSVAEADGDAAAVKEGVDGVVYHEATHVWQWNGQGNANGGLIEGIADYVRLKAGLPAGNWGPPGEGSKWDEGYAVTAYFLDYCDSLKPGFVAKLNGKLKDGYSDDFFMQILGKSVDQLWSDYKAKYSQG